mgnify:CR=1 FL=1
MKSRITAKNVKDLKLKFLNNLAVYGAEVQMEFANKFMQPFEDALRHVFEITDDESGCDCGR